MISVENIFEIESEVNNRDFVDGDSDFVIVIISVDSMIFGEQRLEIRLVGVIIIELMIDE